MSESSRPSTVHPQTVLVGVFGSGEMESVAMCVTRLLASEDSDWTEEFSYELFTNWVNSQASELNELYVHMFRMFGEGFIVKGVRNLVAKGYLVQRDTDDATYFTATEKFSDVMKRYAVA
jgi:hypothetical protein